MCLYVVCGRVYFMWCDSVWKELVFVHFGIATWASLWARAIPVLLRCSQYLFKNSRLKGASLWALDRTRPASLMSKAGLAWDGWHPLLAATALLVCSFWGCNLRKRKETWPCIVSKPGKKWSKRNALQIRKSVDRWHYLYTLELFFKHFYLRSS